MVYSKKKAGEQSRKGKKSAKSPVANVNKNGESIENQINSDKRKISTEQKSKTAKKAAEIPAKRKKIDKTKISEVPARLTQSAQRSIIDSEHDCQEEDEDNEPTAYERIYAKVKENRRQRGLAMLNNEDEPSTSNEGRPEVEVNYNDGE